MTTGGPPPLPIRARNRGTTAHLANARVATRISWKALLATALIFIAIFTAIYVVRNLMG